MDGEKTIMDLLEELRNDPDFIQDEETRKKMLFGLFLTLIEI